VAGDEGVPGNGRPSEARSIITVLPSVGILAGGGVAGRIRPVSIRVA
jgi:hypothetical protein